MYTILSSTVVLEPPAPGARDATWTPHRELPTLSVQRYGCMGCVSLVAGTAWAPVRSCHRAKRCQWVTARTEGVSRQCTTRGYISRMCGCGWMHHRRRGRWSQISRYVRRGAQPVASASVWFTDRRSAVWYGQRLAV